MKIRKGFVSNSSSSSFCIMGIEISKEDLIKAYYKSLGKDISTETRIEPGCKCDIDRNAMKAQGFGFCPRCRCDLFVEKELYEDNAEMCEELDLDYEDAAGELYVGRNLKTNLNVEGIINGIKATEKKLKELFNHDIEIRVHHGITYG